MFVITVFHCEIGLLFAPRCFESCPVSNKSPNSVKAGGSEGNVSVKGVGAYWDTYSSNASTWVVLAAASSPVKPLVATFLTFHVLGERNGIHFSSFLMLAIIHLCHLLAVVSETDLVGPSFFSSIMKGLSCPTL